MAVQGAEAAVAGRDFLEKIGWSKRMLARRVDVPEQTIRRMLAGTAPMDPALLQWLNTTADYMQKNPPPRPKIRVD
jgi:plasmid maintenance system antidote protein VapI